ncbi:MAG TPA: hypothetical protein PKK95_12500 [Vicinamibacterales bacterium]|nr:hypothetical protein [Vicinamibacterales bacterium]
MFFPAPCALSFQAGYRCRHSGACCTAGWPIPVDEGRAALIRAGSAQRLVPAGNFLPKDSSGACGFYDRDARLCRIHARLGLDALPISCAHFPRRLLIEDDRIAISLSHFCPTVAGMLFDPGATGCPAGQPGIVEAPRLLEGIEPEGLDARGAWPPLLRPGVLAGVAAYRLWERAVVEMLAAAEGGADAALARAAAMTREIAGWTPGAGPLESWVVARARASSRSPVVDPPAASDWGGHDPAVGRYLAAKAFANWVAYLGDGLQAVLGSVERALAVLREEAAAACARASRPLDRPLLTEAFRRADLRLMHLDR